MTATMIPGPVAGPGIATADLDSVLGALEGFDPGIPWEAARGSVVPMFPRRRGHPFDTANHVRVTLPPGLVVGFGLDLGPAVAFIGEPQLAGWGIGPADLVAAALGNVHERARSIPLRDRAAIPVDAVPVEVIQSQVGVAAALLLVPDELARLLGPGPKVLAAPMRDVLLVMPDGIEPAEADWISEHLASLDPNSLDLGLFRYRQGSVARLERGLGDEGPSLDQMMN